MSRQTSIQLTPQTDKQWKELSAAGYGNFTDIVRLSIDRMYQQHQRRATISLCLSCTVHDCTTPEWQDDITECPDYMPAL